MKQCAMTTEKPTRWATSGRRSTWALSAPAHALEDNRYDTSAALDLGLMFSVMLMTCGHSVS